ncbi:hypothetical protein MCEZE9_00481 [Candidatus Nanopelagicaceae bacterium]
MRRNILTWALVVGVASVFLVPNSSAAVKAGAACTKVGGKSVSGGKSYTCIKSGKKLVWDKGVLVAKPSVAKPTPAPSASAEASASPKPVVVPAVTYPEGPTSFDDLVEKYQGISYAAWRKSTTVLKAADKVVVPFNSVTGPKTTLAYKTPEKIYDLVSRMYTGYQSAKDLTVLSFSYDDRDWAEQQMRTIQPSSTWQWIKFTACETRETCWGGGMHTDASGKGLMVMTTEVVDENHTSGTLDAHEYTHAVQQNQMGRSQPWPPSGTWPPTWYLEGQANYTQYVAVYNESFEEYRKKRRPSDEGLYRDSKITSQWIQDYFVVDPPADWFNKYERWRQYDLGAMLIEVLTAVKGPASTMELWKQCGTGLKFKDAFEKVYGISFDKALPNISKAIALQLGRS